MSRLLQGDVGSGKTVVAAAAMLAAVFDGYQGALMAPTEVLAEQHYLSVTRMLSGGGESPTLDEHVVSLDMPSLGRPVTVALLIGSLRKRAKDEASRAHRGGRGGRGYRDAGAHPGNG